jgi:alpha-D-xyloside xylohydrolase
LHGSGSYRVPWLFDEESVDVLRKFTKLKCSLMPYIFAASRQAHQKGTPVMRAMILEFPDDPACDYLDRQYMLGNSLLVAPVFSSSGQVEYYVPAGLWTNFLTGNIVQGPAWVRETHDFMSLPLMVRPNSIIPVGNHNDRPDYDFSDGVTLHLYELEDGKSSLVEIPSLTGDIETTFDVKREAKTILIRRNGPSKEWQVMLAGVRSIRSAAKGGEVIQTPQGSLIKPAMNTNELKINLL